LTLRFARASADRLLMAEQLAYQQAAEDLAR